jgi:hypothetical protein
VGRAPNGRDYGLREKSEDGHAEYKRSHLQMKQNIKDSQRTGESSSEEPMLGCPFQRHSLLTSTEVLQTIFGRAPIIEKPILYPSPVQVN